MMPGFGPHHLAAASLLLLALAACGRMMAPDLERLYLQTEARTSQPPVILIHGVLGAKLRERDDGREVWPGGIARLAFSDYRELTLPLTPAHARPGDDGLVASAIFDRAAGRDFYGSILRTLEGPGGYRRGDAASPAGGDTRQYYVFLYDWRRDNVQSLRALDELIERIRAAHADPGLRVDLIAHSNGGLIARYYARYGTADLLDGNDFPVSQAGAAKIRRLILLGTPNFGSVSAITALVSGAEVGLRAIPPEVLMSFPSTYQLLPHAINDWLIDASGRPLDRDVFDADTWRRLQWAIYDPTVRERIAARFEDAAAAAQYIAAMERHFARHLERARRFTWSLTVPEPVGGVHPVVFGGDCTLTPSRLLIEEVDGDSVLRLWPGEIAAPRAGVDYDRLMLEPGDGTVTKASLLAREALDPARPRHPWSHFPLDYAFFLCEHHDRLTANPSFQDNLLHALLSVDR